jgi:riboflavin kinase/FMN adenylyltransferase
MQIFNSLAEIPSEFGPAVAAIGNFDGVHRGHRYVLAQVLDRARGRNARAVALTFDPHPIRVLRPDVPFKLITPLASKLELLATTGIDAVVVLPFTRVFSETPAYTFAEQVLARGIRAIEVHEGDNFRFGKDAGAGTAELAAFGRELGFSVVVYSAQHAHGSIVSSSAVRERIAAGDLRRTRWMLDRSFFIDAAPARGRGIGAKLLVPTINLAAYPELLPAHGVYVTQLVVAGRCFNAVTNIGNRPTFGEDSFAVESYLLNYDPAAEPVELSEQTQMRLHFLARIREERKWPTPEALKAQIMKDVGFAQRYFRLAQSH